jgi:hypothetical protein
MSEGNSSADRVESDELYLRGLLTYPEPLPFAPWSDRLSHAQRVLSAGWEARAKLDREFL